MESFGVYSMRSPPVNQSISVSAVSEPAPLIQNKDPFTILASQIHTSAYNLSSLTEEKSDLALDENSCSSQTRQPVNIQMALLADHLSCDNMGIRTSQTFSRMSDLHDVTGDRKHHIMSGRNKAKDDSLLNRKYPCPLCGKRFRFNSILSLHMRTHTGEKPFKCPYCDHRAAQKGNLKIHLRTHRLAMQSKSLGRSGEDSHLLHELEQRAISREKQASSASLPSSNVLSYSPQDAMVVSCNAIQSQACPDSVTSVQEKPLLVLQQSFQCRFCKGKFRKQDELERHIRILHKPYKCTLCEFAAALESDLLQHVEKVHVTSEAVGVSPHVVVQGDFSKEKSPTRAFRCEVCGQMFKQAWFLKGHMRKHKDSYEHSCGVCGRRFKESWFLKNHMKVHLNKLAAQGHPPGQGRTHTTHNNGREIPSRLQSQIISRLHNEVLLAVLSERQKVLAEAGIELDSQRVLEKLLLPVPGHAHSLAAVEMQKQEESSHTQSPYKNSQAINVAVSSTHGGDQAVELYSHTEKLNVLQKHLEIPENLLTRGKLNCTAKAKESLNNQGVNGSPCSDKSSQRAGLIDRFSYQSSGPEVNSARWMGGWTGRPSECPECGRVFRTYHQLVLHSRVHRKQRQLRGEETSSGWMPNRNSGSGSSCSPHPQHLSQLLSAFSKPGESGVYSATEGSGATGGLPVVGKSSQVSSQPSILFSGLSHQARVGAGGKECSVCGKNFRTAQRLKVHSRIHTGEKPYKCPFCDYAGSQFTSLKYHLQRHHNQPPTPSHHGDDPCKPWTPQPVRGFDDDEDPSFEPQQEPLDLSIKGEGGPETDRTPSASHSFQRPSSSSLASSSSPLMVSSLHPSASTSFSTFSSNPCSSITPFTSTSTSLSLTDVRSPFSVSSSVSSSLFSKSSLGSCSPFIPSLMSPSPFSALYASSPLSVSPVRSLPPYSPPVSSLSSFSLLTNSSVITSHRAAASSSSSSSYDSLSEVTSSVCAPPLCTPSHISAPSTSLFVSPEMNTPSSSLSTSPQPMTKGSAGASLEHPEFVISHYDTGSNLEKRGKEEEVVVPSSYRETGSVGLFLQESGHSQLPWIDVGRHGVGVIVSKFEEAVLLEH